MTIEEARALAAETKTKVLAGEDPLEERERNGVSIGQFAAVYLERYAKPHKKSWKQDQQWLQQYIIPAFAGKSFAQIKARDVAFFHGDIGKNFPTLANRLCEILSKMFNLAQLWGYVEELKLNPTIGLKPFKEASRDRWLRPEELERMAISLELEQDLYVRGFFYLSLHTCLRHSELLSLRWSQVDLYSREITLADTKSGRPHYLPLTSKALEILKSLPRIEGNPFLICGRDDGKQRNNVQKAWRRIRSRAGLDDVTIHDLRRTGGSILAQNGASLALIGQVLNQSNERVTAVYARFAKDNIRAAMESNSNIIERQLGVAVCST